MTVHRDEEIRRRLAEGRSLREIARALGCSRRTVRRGTRRRAPLTGRARSRRPIRCGCRRSTDADPRSGPGSSAEVPVEERARQLTTYPNFWKQFYRKFPQYREASVTAREFEPGERVEVDYAGDPIAWIHVPTGEIRKAWVFVAGLGFSQLLFAWAAEDMKSRNWLASHRRMCAITAASRT
ncbi:MAG: helix-turn-helix domain-containing protein [Gammaproteobacteria bacterium]|nr:helix-turn-helix domain-containing protein [Gammaproteobacteria bacterium]